MAFCKSTASDLRFAEVKQEEIYQIINDVVPQNTKRRLTGASASLEVSKLNKNGFFVFELTPASKDWFGISLSLSCFQNSFTSIYHFILFSIKNGCT